VRRLVMSTSLANGMAHMAVAGQAGTGVELTLNDYLVTTDSDATIINFSAHTFRSAALSEGQITDLVADLDKKTPTLITKFEFDTMKVAAGDTIEGRPTRHYELKLDFHSFQPDSLNVLKQSSSTVTSDYWVADLPVRFNNPFIGFAFPKPGYSPGLKTWIDKIHAAADVVNSGTAVKYGYTSQSQIEWPRPLITKRTMDLTGCTPKDLDPSLFVIPPGYKLSTRGAGPGGER
jgi:hypothetical protein